MKAVSLSRRVYQRTTPIYLCAFIIGFMIVQYFIKWDPLEALQKETLRWANIISLWVWLFACVMLVLNCQRRISRFREDRRAGYEGAIILASTVVFLLLALIDPAKLDANPVYSASFKFLIGSIYLGIESTAITYQGFNVFRRFAMMRLTPENVVIILTCIAMFVRGIALITYNVPQAMTIAEWVEKVPYSTTSRASVVVSAVGTLILGARALVGREPGIIEMELA